jgi:hypothetical protein
MKLKTTSFILLLSVCKLFALHPLKLSVIDITHSEKKITVKMKLFVDDTEACLGQYIKKPFSLVQFAGKDIDSPTQKQMAAYIAERFKISINNAPMQLFFKKAYLDQAKLFTDFAVVYMELEAKWILTTTIRSIKITDTIFFETIPEQKNIVNIHIDKYEHVMKFDNQENSTTAEATF